MTPARPQSPPATAPAFRRPISRPAPSPPQPAPYDPLRLCVYATVALLAWILGPVAVLGFAAIGVGGYWRARRAGLTRSKCVLRDTRLVLAYLSVIALAGAAGIAWRVYTLLAA